MVLVHGPSPRVVKKTESSRPGEAGEMEKITGDISNFGFPNACQIELRAFREAGTFVE